MSRPKTTLLEVVMELPARRTGRGGSPACRPSPREHERCSEPSAEPSCSKRMQRRTCAPHIASHHWSDAISPTQRAVDLELPRLNRECRSQRRHRTAGGDRDVRAATPPDACSLTLSDSISNFARVGNTCAESSSACSDSSAERRYSPPHAQPRPPQNTVNVRLA